jgi:hypothetical protein
MRLLASVKARAVKRGVFDDIPRIDAIVADLRQRENLTVQDQLQLLAQIEQRISATAQARAAYVAQNGSERDAMATARELAEQTLAANQTAALGSLRREWAETISRFQDEIGAATSRAQRRHEIDQSETLSLDDASEEKSAVPLYHPSGRLLSMRLEARKLVAAGQYRDAESWMVRADALEMAEMKEMLFQLRRKENRAIKTLQAKQRVARTLHEQFWERKREALEQKYAHNIGASELRLRQLTGWKHSLRRKITRQTRENDKGETDEDAGVH